MVRPHLVALPLHFGRLVMHLQVSGLLLLVGQAPLLVVQLAHQVVLREPSTQLLDRRRSLAFFHRLVGGMSATQLRQTFAIGIGGIGLRLSPNMRTEVMMWSMRANIVKHGSQVFAFVQLLLPRLVQRQLQKSRRKNTAGIITIKVGKMLMANVARRNGIVPEARKALQKSAIAATTALKTRKESHGLEARMPQQGSSLKKENEGGVEKRVQIGLKQIGVRYPLARLRQWRLLRKTQVASKRPRTTPLQKRRRSE